MTALEDAIKSAKFSHTRARYWCRVWVGYVYHHDLDSPTGVKLAATGDEKEVVVLCAKHGRTSPLSPTEGLL